MVLRLSLFCAKGRLASAEYREPLVDPRQNDIGQEAKDSTENAPSEQQISHKPSHIRPEFLSSLVIAASRHCGYRGDMALYPVEQNAKGQKEARHGQTDAEKLNALRCPVLDEEACRHQRCGREAKSDCAKIDCSEYSNQASPLYLLLAHAREGKGFWITVRCRHPPLFHAESPIGQRETEAGRFGDAARVRRSVRIGKKGPEDLAGAQIDLAKLDVCPFREHDHGGAR